MIKKKRSFTLVELAVVMMVILVLATMMFFGISQTRSDEGLNADYLGFTTDLKSLQLRANLGQLAPITPAVTPTAKHTIVFTMPNATSYLIDGMTVNFKNGSKITRINNSASAGVVTISFVPNSNNYQGPTPPGGLSFAVRGATSLSSPVTIELTGKSSSIKTITITGSTFFISNIN